MRTRAGWIVLALVAATGMAQAAEERANQVFGNWEGTYTTDTGETDALRAKIVGDGENDYHAIFIVNAEGQDMEAVVPGKTNRGVTHFEGEVELGEGSYTIAADVTKGLMKGTFKGDREGTIEMKRVEIKPPSLGAKAPEGAIVLMDGTPDTFYKSFDIQPHWVVQSDGSVCISGSNAVTKQKFGDAEYHLEFKTRYMPNERGQARSNSGFYIAGRYEIQVLDSFGQKPADNLCGGIYQMAVPKVDAVLPPLEWQTYDVTYHAPKFDANGKKTQNAVITVKHNGQVIHDNLELPHLTPGGVSGQEAPEGPILLQDHGDQPWFANLWVKPLQ